MYRDLDTASREIRLLGLLPSEFGTVSAILEYVSLDEDPVFSALSYVWGDSKITEEILVDGQPFEATVNLVAASSQCPEALV